jgi:hypothetical protein
MGSSQTREQVHRWSVTEVAKQVAQFGGAYCKYDKTIKANGIDGKMLLELHLDDLDELVEAKSHRTKLRSELQALQTTVSGGFSESGLCSCLPFHPY